MDLCYESEIYSIIESSTNNIKLNECIYYKLNTVILNEIIDKLSNKFKILNYKLLKQSKNPLHQFVKYIKNNSNLEFNTTIQKITLWKERLIPNINIDMVLLFKNMNLYNQENDSIIDYLFNLRIDKYFYNLHEFSEWFIETINRRLDIQINDKYSEFVKKMDKNNEYIYKSYSLMNYFNSLKEDIYNLNTSDLNNHKFMHINIVNKCTDQVKNYINYKISNNDCLKKLSLININSKPLYKFFFKYKKSIINIEKDGLINIKYYLNVNNYSIFLEKISEIINIYNMNNENMNNENMNNDNMNNDNMNNDNMNNDNMNNDNMNNDNMNNDNKELCNCKNIFTNSVNDILDKGFEFYDKKIVLFNIDNNVFVKELVKSFLMCGSKIILITDVNNKFYKKIYRKYGSKNSELIIYPIDINKNNHNETDKSEINNNHIVEFIFNKFSKNIDLIIPTFKQSSNYHNNKNNIYIHDYFTKFLDLLYIKLNENNIISENIQIIIPFIQDIDNLIYPTFNSINTNCLNKEISKYNSKYKGSITISSINFGIMKDKNKLLYNLIYNELEKLKINIYDPKECVLLIFALLDNKMINIYTNNPININLSDIGNNLFTIIQGIQNKFNEELNYKYYINNFNKFKNINNESIDPKYNFNSLFPKINAIKNTKKLPLNYDNIIVIVGYGENSIYGNSRTRLDIEKNGNLSLESCLELCWYIGLIKYNSNNWIDCDNNQPISEYNIYLKYEQKINKLLNIKLEKNTLNNNIHKKHTLENDIINIEIHNIYEEEYLINKYQNNIIIKKTDGKKYGIIKKGTEIILTCSLNLLNKDIKNLEIFGIPQHILKSIDNISLYSIIASADALISAGISDPYEIFQYISKTDIGNVIGMGNTNIKGGIVTDNNTIINNTISYWFNKVLLNSSGPSRIPDDGYNTFALSMEEGVDLILQQKAKMVFVGSSDINIQENTVNDNKMYSSTNKNKYNNMNFQNFSSSILILTSAQLAIDMGLPIYGICAHSNSSLKIKDIDNIKYNNNFEKINKEFDIDSRINKINELINKNNITDGNLINYIKKYYGHEFYKNCDEIYNLLGALAVWNLNIDDISCAIYNNYNNSITDCNILQKQIKLLGRSPGNLLPILKPTNTYNNHSCSIGFIINTVLNGFNDNKINLKNIFENILEDYNLMFNPSSDLEFDKFKSILIKNINADNNSCSDLLIINPQYLLSNLDEDLFEKYKNKNLKRNYLNFRIWDNILYNKRCLIHFKSGNQNKSYVKNILQSNLDLDKLFNINTVLYNYGRINNNNKINYNNNINNEQYNLLKILDIYSKHYDNSIKYRGIGFESNNIHENISIKYKKYLTKNEIKKYKYYSGKILKYLCIFTAKISFLQSLSLIIEKEQHDYTLNINFKTFNEIEIIVNDKNSTNIKVKGNIKNILKNISVKYIKLLMCTNLNNSYALTLLN